MTILLIAPFVLFFPGYFLTLALPWVKNFAQRVGFSVVTTVALGVVVSFFAALFKLPVGKSFLIFMAVLTVAAAFIAGENP